MKNLKSLRHSQLRVNLPPLGWVIFDGWYARAVPDELAEALLNHPKYSLQIIEVAEVPVPADQTRAKVKKKAKEADQAPAPIDPRNAPSKAFFARRNAASDRLGGDDEKDPLLTEDELALEAKIRVALIELGHSDLTSVRIGLAREGVPVDATREQALEILTHNLGKASETAASEAAKRQPAAPVMTTDPRDGSATVMVPTARELSNMRKNELEGLYRRFISDTVPEGSTRKTLIADLGAFLKKGK